VLKISEELEKVKQEMEEKGSSMSDGGKPHAQQTIFPSTDGAVCLCKLEFMLVRVFCDAAPVVKIRQSLTKLKQEIEQMDVRMGVVEHTLLQSKLREKNNMTRDMHATHLLEPNAQTY